MRNSSLFDILWLTDLHLEFAPAPTKRHALYEAIRAAAPDAILIGGDTDIAPSIEKTLLTLDQQFEVPIYFVLGNHDFYHGSIRQVRDAAARLPKRAAGLNWLPNAGVVGLSANTALIGHGGWADGRLGHGIHSAVQLNDFLLINELTGLAVEARFKTLNALGDEAAAHFRRVLPAALKDYRNVLMLTHVPPFKDACWHEGRISDDDYLPHFTCKVVGDVLVEIMQGRPECNLTVLCGHTHGQGEAEILPNLIVKTGGATYGDPKIQEVIEVI